MSPDRELLKSVKVRAIGVALYPPGATYGPRRMQDYEFVWVIEGGGTIHYDEQPIPALPGTIALGRPGMTDRYDWEKKSRTIHAFCHFQVELPRRGWPPPQKWPLFHRLPPDDIFRPLFRYLLGADPLPEPLRSRLMHYGLGLMLECFVTGKFRITSEPHGQLPPPIEQAFKAIADLVSKEPAPSMTLPQLARAAHVSPRHLCRIFRDTLDMTPLECVNLARLDRAAMLLGRSNLPINQVADLTGFSSAYYFSKAFRRVYQKSPRAYRKAIRAGDEEPPSAVVKFIQSDFLSKIA